MENKLITIVCLFGILSYVSCENNLYMETVGNKTIYYNDIPMNWYAAFQTCASHGLQLLTINSALENFEISEYVRGFSHFISIWTSGTDAGNEGKWSWMSTGRTFEETFSYWFKDEPNNIQSPCMGEDCLMVGYREVEHCWFWNDSICTLKIPSICEKP